MRSIVALIFILIGSNYAYSQLTDTYRQYIKRSINENPLSLIESLEPYKQADLTTKLLIGELYFLSGNNIAAAEIIEDGINRLEKLNRTENEVYARALSNRGLIYWNQGKNQKATDYLERSLAITVNLDIATAFITNIYNNLGLVLKSTGELEQAEKYFKKIITLGQEGLVKDQEILALVNINLALLEAEQNKEQRAANRLNLLLSEWRKSHQQKLPTEAFILTNLGAIYAEMNQAELSRSFLKEAIEIYRDFYGSKNPELANTYLILANLEGKQGNFKRALGTIQNALISNSLNFTNTDYFTNPASTDFIKPSYQVSILENKAKLFEDYYFQFSLKRKHLEAALNCLKKADSLLIRIRNNTTNKKDQLALNTQAASMYEFTQRILITLDDISLFKGNYLEQAFLYAEKSKANNLIRSVIESEAKTFANIPDSVLQKEKKIKSDLSYLNSVLSNSTDEKKIKEIKNKLFILQRTYEEFIISLETQFPTYYKLKYNSKFLSVSDIQSRISDDELVLSYALAPSSNQIYRYEITKETFKHSIIYKLDNIERYTKAFRNIIIYNIQPAYQPFSTKLFNWLLPKRVDRKITKLSIIPDGILGTLPFSAIIYKSTKDNDFSSFNFLINRYAISYNYSASFQANISKSFNSEAALLLAPVNFETFNLNKLPATERELEALRVTLSENNISPTALSYDNATEEAIKNINLKPYKYIHFATHGITNNTNPELSAIYLNSSNPESRYDGILYTNEIYNLQLDAEIVCLSACETGIGQFNRGEGLIGLGRAFSYAGANNLLVSLWNVNDASTALLMEQFYKYMVLNKYENTRSLQLAQQKLIANDYANPYFWASFVLYGQ